MKDMPTRLVRPLFVQMDLEMKRCMLNIPNTFIEVKHVVEEHIFDNPDNNYRREVRWYRIVYCLFSKMKACEWVRYMNRQIKERGHKGNFRLKQFRQTTANNYWYGTTKVWRYARRQDWRFIPRIAWTNFKDLPPAILSVPISTQSDDLFDDDD